MLAFSHFRDCSMLILEYTDAYFISPYYRVSFAIASPYHAAPAKGILSSLRHSGAFSLHDMPAGRAASCQNTRLILFDFHYARDRSGRAAICGWRYEKSFACFQRDAPLMAPHAQKEADFGDMLFADVSRFHYAADAHRHASSCRAPAS